MANDSIQQQVTQSGAYEVIRGRLEQQAETLLKHAQALNQSRIEKFGQTELSIAGRVRVRTENNCHARDIVRVQDYLLFGYNVFIGLKTEITVDDVFSLYSLTSSDQGFELSPVTDQENFLHDKAFSSDFAELYNYYQNAKLLQLQYINGKLLATFQIGKKLSDIRVFRWQIHKDGSVEYIDNRGERDTSSVKNFDFEWIKTTRNDHVSGRYPHINILDTVFVETIDGDLTIKIENNTEDGLGIYQEPVQETDQSLGDADILYARVGSLILLKIKPYRENEYRYLIYNTLTEAVNRIDAIGNACICLPEDHGIIFPGGYYLQSGQTKSFPLDISGLKFERQIRSPNGEDVLYIFYQPEKGLSVLLNYNMIQKSVQNPIYGHGYGIFEDGLAVIFQTESEEATRIHPMQIWNTPFYSDDYAASKPQDDSFLGRIGNADLVRGISDLFSLCRLINDGIESVVGYNELNKACSRLFDNYFWLEQEENQVIGHTLKEINNTSEQILDEFEKVQSIRAQADQAILNSQLHFEKLDNELAVIDYNNIEAFTQGLSQLYQQNGHLISLREQRFINLEQLGQLEQTVTDKIASLSQKTIEFLSKEHSLDSFHSAISAAEQALPGIDNVKSLKPVNEKLNQLGAQLDVLNETVSNLDIDDTRVRTDIISRISTVYGTLNQTKARAKKQLKALGSEEARLEFSAQFTLFSQSIANAMSLVDTPESADDQVAKLYLQLEELESRFSEFDEFLADILQKREELRELFEERKQALVDERQRKALQLADAAQRIIDTVTRRAQHFKTLDELNAFFASDPMLRKVSKLVEQLYQLKDPVKADDITAKLKSSRETAIRGLRDKIELFSDGGQSVKLGEHQFSINRQNLELTLIPKKDQLVLHLSGSDFYQPIDDPTLNELKPYWSQLLASETHDIYRSEYLAGLIIDSAEKGLNQLSWKDLVAANKDSKTLHKLVENYAIQRIQDGYEKGIHDHDAACILTPLIDALDQAGLLKYNPSDRALVLLYLCYSKLDDHVLNRLHHSAKTSSDLLTTFHNFDAHRHWCEQVSITLNEFHQAQALPFNADFNQAASYFLEYLVDYHPQKKDGNKTQISASAKAILDVFSKLEDIFSKFEQSLSHLKNDLSASYHYTKAWLDGALKTSHLSYELHHRYLDEAAAILLTKHQNRYKVDKTPLHVTATDLLGEHPRIQQHQLTLDISEFKQRFWHHQTVNNPGFKQFNTHRHQYLNNCYQRFQLDDYKPRPLTSFVRNTLINEVYLPIIGANLAKQMGTSDAKKRTDLMGLLLLISPPGYGKTTLMEYIANRLGLIFVKVNCPALGHQVTSLDPNQARNASAQRELEKLNFAFEMANNVMLYLDDIQHTDPEFLQKFISLCDGTRRIEGIFNGNSKTYDLRGKKFSIVMAGNPYTESGEVFKIPDMLANRADIYNLGDVLSGKDKAFSLSYIENCLTSNSVLAPLALRKMDDLYLLIRMAQGETIALSELSYNYAQAEADEIIRVIKKLFTIRDVVLTVNQQYIESAAQAQHYRTAPAFKLQGSYRNMNKMAEKITATMNDEELQALISDHYRQEAQTLTTGAEENLLQLGSLLGTLSPKEEIRWQSICDEYQRRNRLGDDDSDPVAQISQQLSLINQGLSQLTHLRHLKSEQKTESVREKNEDATAQKLAQMVSRSLLEIARSIKTLKLDTDKPMETPPVHVDIQQHADPDFEKMLGKLLILLEQNLIPVLQTLENRSIIQLNMWEKIKDMGNTLEQLDKS